MTQQSNNIDDILGERLEALRQVPDRENEAAALGRERYLAQMRTVLGEISPDQAVSGSPIRRLNGWINNILALQYRRKERVPMLATLMALILSVSLMFGGAGATAFAAHNSLPNDILYPVKTAAEDARLDLTSNPTSEVDLLLTYADRRTNEILTMGITGEAIPESVVSRLGGHYKAIFLIVTELDEPEAKETLQEVGNSIRKHDRDWVMKEDHPNNKDKDWEDVRYMVQNMFRYGMDLVEIGLVDFDAFVEEIEPYRYQNHGPWWVEETPDAEDGGYGPGPGDPACEECEPAQDGSGPGPGPGPSNQGEDTNPDEGYGPGPGPGDPACEECEPAQDGSGPGPGPGPSNQGEETEPDEGYGPPDGDDGNGPSPGPGPSNEGEETEPDEGYGPPDGDEGSGPSPGPGPTNQGEETEPDESYGPPDSDDGNGSGPKETPPPDDAPGSSNNNGNG